MTYAADVAAILHRRCSPCHRRGQVAPFPLLTYEHARQWATSIGEVIAQGRMPPWGADPRFGRFANDRSLLAHERSVLNAWIAQGAPPGELSTAPAPRNFPLDWSIGTPDIDLRDARAILGPGGGNAADPALPTGDQPDSRTFGSSLLRLARAIGRSFTTFAFTSMITANAHVRNRGSRTCWSPTRRETFPPCFLRESPRGSPVAAS